MALADKESSLLPDSKARTSSAEGLFQFIESTWLEVLRRYGPKYGYAIEAEVIHIVEGRPVVPDGKDRERILRLRRIPYLSALLAGEMITGSPGDPGGPGGARSVFCRTLHGPLPRRARSQPLHSPAQ